MAALSASAAPSRRQVPIVCPGHTRPLTEVHYSPVTNDGYFLISGCHDKLPMLRRGDSGDWIGTFSGHKGAVWSAKLDSEALLAATGAADFSAKVWDAITGQELQELPHKHIVKCVEFSSDRNSLVTAGLEGILRVFDLSTGVATTELHHSSEAKVTINKAVWGVDDAHNIILSGGNDGVVNVWDVRTGAAAAKLTVEGLVMDMELSSPKGLGSVLTVAAGSHVTMFNAETFAQLNSHSMPINFKEEGGASLHPSGTKFIAGGSDCYVHVFDTTSGTEIECHKGHHGPVRCLRYAPDGATYATGSEDGTIRIWETEPASAVAPAGP